MTEHEQAQHLADELDTLINRYRTEYEMCFATAVGVLQFKAFLLMREAQAGFGDGGDGEP